MLENLLEGFVQTDQVTQKDGSKLVRTKENELAVLLFVSIMLVSQQVDA